jgi:uncharacterized membrane protein YvlD (DUF360 family)
LVILIGEAFGLLLLIQFIPGLSVNSFAAAFAFVVVLGVVNAILWPILTRSTLRFLTYTFGIGALLLNALLVWLTSKLVPGASASFRALKQLDKQFHRIEHATSYAPRPYQFVVLSDHGQANGATFTSDVASISKVSSGI